MRILKIVTSNSPSIVITTGVMQLYNTGKLHTNMFLFLNFSKALFKQLCFSSEIFKTTKYFLQELKNCKQQGHIIILIATHCWLLVFPRDRAEVAPVNLPYRPLAPMTPFQARPISSTYRCIISKLLDALRSSLPAHKL